MTRPLVTAREDDGIDVALDLMSAHGVRRLPVVTGGGALVGILALDDLTEHLARRLAALVTVVARERDIERRHRP